MCFNFNVEGDVKHYFADNHVQYSLNPLQGTITTTPSKTDHGIELARNKKITFACMMIDRKKYLEKIDCLLDKMPERLRNIFSDVMGKEAFFHQGNYSITSAECIRAMVNDKHKGIVRSTYLEGIALELLSCQIKQFKDDLKSPGKQTTLRKRDAAKIIEAKEMLISNIKNPPTIEALAKHVGINQTKLKEGFKEIYDEPIKTWLRNKKLEVARLLLIEDQNTIGEIAEAVGYANIGHFSRKFKEKYGTLPKDYLKSVRNKYYDLVEQ